MRFENDLKKTVKFEGEVSVASYPVAGTKSNVCKCNGVYKKASLRSSYNQCD